jgi:hypothetical protein
MTPCLPCEGNRGPVPVTVYLGTRHRSATAPGWSCPSPTVPAHGPQWLRHAYI